MKAWVAVAALALAGSGRAATPELAVPIRQFMDSLARGDNASAAAACLPDITITDEVAPFHWRGKDALAKWGADLASNDKAAGIADQKVAIRPATREVVKGDMAYVIVPATFTFTEKGMAMRESAQLTFVLKRQAAGWKIAAWTWTGPAPKAAPAGK